MRPIKRRNRIYLYFAVGYVCLAALFVEDMWLFQRLADLPAFLNLAAILTAVIGTYLVFTRGYYHDQKYLGSTGGWRAGFLLRNAFLFFPFIFAPIYLLVREFNVRLMPKQ